MQYFLVLLNFLYRLWLFILLVLGCERDDINVNDDENSRKFQGKILLLCFFSICISVWIQVRRYLDTLIMIITHIE